MQEIISSVGSKTKVVKVELKREIKPMNVKINLTDTNSFSGEIRSSDKITNASSEKKNSSKKSILARLRQASGIKTNHSAQLHLKNSKYPKIQCKSFNL